MIKKCTNEFLLELEQKLLDNKITSLTIIEKEDGYYAEYVLIVEPIKSLNLSLRLQAASAIKEFAALLLVDKVNNFSMYYVLEENKCVVNSSYKLSPSEITRDVKLAKMKEMIAQALSIAVDINIKDLALPDVIERPKKQKGNSNAKLHEVSIEYALNKINEVLE